MYNVGFFFIKKCTPGPGWFGSVDRASACGVEGSGFDSGQGTCLGCNLYPHWGTCRRQPINDSLSLLMFLSLFPSPFLSEINKDIFLKNKIKVYTWARCFPIACVDCLPPRQGGCLCGKDVLCCVRE
uniref:Uncharacterized protein n=1 Tax=Pipistrellus kuhlii TaxID=59472 RepID=A0A7J7XVM4_PIPKU|nr:hypothetical protein mPipKuh1_010501 [Pipistrellus kuhlii]